MNNKIKSFISIPNCFTFGIVKSNALNSSLILLTLTHLLIGTSLKAQSPQAIPYQAVARDASGNMLANQTISIQFSIHDSITTGPIVYQETQQVTTTSLGLFTCNLGQGTPIVGTLASVNWSTGNKFLQVEMDPSGGTNYTDMGTTQLMSVPYALYAGSSNGWTTSGNSGTNDVSNALGTNDATDLVIKTDNFETARLFSNPETGGGINPPTDRLRLMRSGAAYQKWPMVASFQLGSYEANIEGRTQMDIALLYGSGVNADNKVMSLLANGNVGIGNTTPHAPLQFGNNLLNRKLVLYETNDNDHEFLGFGINPGMLRYQVANAGDNHVFFSGNGSNTSNELMRITGSGNVGIGTSSPTEQLHTTAGVRFAGLSGTNKRPVFVDSTGKLSAGIDSIQSFSATLNAVFNNYYESTIQVQGEPIVSSNLISVHINYANDNARIFLKSPAGEILNLVSIGNGLFINVNATFNDNGSAFPANQTTLNGSIQPAGDMSVVGGNITPTISSFGAFGGGSMNPNGTWTLILWTAYNVSNGQLNNWSITFTAPNNTVGNGYYPKWNNGELSIYSSIYDNGNVGILTTNPQRTLDVHGDIAQGVWTDNLPSRRIGVMDATTQTAGMEIENTTLSGNYSQKLHLLTHHYANGFGRRLTIDEDGKVGIGTETPDNTLTVNGSINITGNVGIGETNPTQKLVVNGDAIINGLTVGRGLLQSNNGSYNNTAFGVNANNGSSSPFANTAIGYLALASYGSGSNYSSAYCTALGSNALSAGVSGSIGYFSTALGCFSATSNINSQYNTSIGGGSTIASNLNNSTAIGYYAYATGNNQVRIGNNYVTSIGGFTNWTNVSDGRVKKNVQANVPGLAFINRLTPVTYNLDAKAINRILQKPEIRDENGKPISKAIEDNEAMEKEKEAIVYSGFIAQDVEKIAKEMKYDFSGVDAAKNDKDLYGLRYAEFVVPLVKAVQELSNQNDVMKKENDELKTQLNNLLQRLDQLEKNNLMIK